MNPVIGLSVGRVAVGAVAFAQPQLGAKLFGLDTAANPQLPHLSRLFGSREVAVGVLTLLARGSARRNLVLAGIAIDLADAVTGALGVTERTVPTMGTAPLVAIALGAAGAGAAGLRVRKRLEV